MAAGLTVAPYSLYISKKMDAVVISDRTLGQMMWLGNNGFDPITFDYGNGQLSQRAFSRHIAEGRGRCAGRKQTIKRDTCETQAGKDWIFSNLPEFVGRMPLRVAQLMNPHSLMSDTSGGEVARLPQWFDEALVYQGLGLLFVILGGRSRWWLEGAGTRPGDGLTSSTTAQPSQRWPPSLSCPPRAALMVAGAGLIARPDLIWNGLREERWRSSCCTRDVLGDTAHPGFYPWVDMVVFQKLARLLEL